MKNILPFLKNDVDVNNAVISRGKMTPRKQARHCNYKKSGLTAQGRRQALKRGEYNMKSQFGGEGHSSYWD
jgi:hypothetical protein